jgi:hypothetical protein
MLVAVGPATAAVATVTPVVLSMVSKLKPISGNCVLAGSVKATTNVPMAVVVTPVIVGAAGAPADVKLAVAALVVSEL